VLHSGKGTREAWFDTSLDFLMHVLVNDIVIIQ
jgi:hypothetical protein